MDSRNEQLSAFLNEHIQAGDFPSAVYLVAQRGEIIFTDALGHSVVEPYSIASQVNTIYDLASLTKPLITGFLCARRLESGALTLDSPIARYLSEFNRTDKELITVRELLTHSSGLPAWVPLYILAEDDPKRTLNAIASLDLEYKPGTRVIYSDLGFVTLGFLLERTSRQLLRELAVKEIFEPLKLQRTYFNPDVGLQTVIAASEKGNTYERNTCEEKSLGQYLNWRRNLIWGEVHDGNAHFLGGAAGHAGLFSTARETLLLAEQFLADHSKLLKPETCSLFRTNMTAGLDEARSIGWQLAETKDSVAGPDLPPDSFGHSGFTGTSCWLDPQHERVFILLTNRTHARSLPFANINSVRRQFHSLAVAALGS
jgi:CubicO group peptidase (beta-lactamase class C family)